MKQLLLSPQNRLPILLTVCLLILALFLLGELGRAQRNAIDATKSAKACQEFSRRIVDLKKLPELVSGSMSSTAQIAQSVEAAMVESAITADKLVRIEPRSATRFEKTPFLEQPSHLELRDVTMEQLVRFLHTLQTQNRLETRDLRLHSSRTQTIENGPEIWSAELVLTNTIYSP
jgi:hypothetical protein